MIYEEVLNRVNQQKKSIDGYPPKFIFVGTVEEYKVIVEALEKQIPKKPKELNVLKEIIAIGRCPICDEGCNSDMKYCSECGQKIDWSEEQD